MKITDVFTEPDMIRSDHVWTRELGELNASKVVSKVYLVFG